MLTRTPTPVSLVICDDVVQDRRTGKISLIGWADSIRAAGYPYVSPSFNVFIALTCQVFTKSSFFARIVR